MFKTLPVILLSLACFQLPAQTDADLLDKARKNAQEMSDAFHAEDYDTFMDFTHPTVIEDIGGREKMKEFLSNGLGPNIEFVSTEIVRAKKLFKKGDTYQCAMKQNQIMEVEGRRYLIAGWLIGISYNAGAEWSYISVSNYTLDHMRQFFPELDKKLPVKPQKEPRPIKN
ncbi:MAG: hypothetical protein Roseis2KO_27990 [Roseivirga sp.]